MKPETRMEIKRRIAQLDSEIKSKEGELQNQKNQLHALTRTVKDMDSRLQEAKQLRTALADDLEDAMKEKSK